MKDLVPSRIRRLLEDQPVAHIGVIAGSEPYVTPVSFVWFQERLWFRTWDGKRMQGLVDHPGVSVEISEFDGDSGTWESIIIAGRAEVVEEAETIAAVEKAIRAKYRRITRLALDLPPDLVPHEGHVIAVDVQELTGRSSGKGIDGPDLPGRLG